MALKLEKQEIVGLLIDPEEINLLRTDIAEIKNLVKDLKVDNSCTKYFSKGEVQQMLKVSRKTLTSYLSKGILPYSQYRGKTLIKSEDLDAFFNRFYVKKNH